MSKTKKNLLFMLCFALIMLVAAAFSAFNANKAHAADVTADDFKVASIGIRLQDNAAETGVRFGVQINEELLNKADAKVTLYMLPQMFYVSGEHLNAGAATAQSVEIPGTGWAGENGYKTAYAYVYDFPANNYGVKLLAEACLTYTENGATVSKWTAVSDAYSLTDVAKIAQEGGKIGADGYIIENARITYKNVVGEQVGSENLTYGATLNYPEVAGRNGQKLNWITSKKTAWNTSWTAQGNMTLICAGDTIDEKVISANGIISESVQEVAPGGFEKVWRTNDKYTTAKTTYLRGEYYSAANITLYKEIYFAAKTDYQFKTPNGYAAANGWFYFTFTQNDDATWNSEVSYIKDGKKVIENGRDIKLAAATTKLAEGSLSALMYSAWYIPYVADTSKYVYFTELRGVKKPIELIGDATIDEKVISANGIISESVQEVAPGGFEKVWRTNDKYTTAKTTYLRGEYYSAANITLYKEIYFAAKTDYQFKTPNGYAAANGWFYFTFTQNDDATWNSEVSYIKDGKKVIENGRDIKLAAATTKLAEGSLSALMYSAWYIPYVADTSKYVYFTELRGVKKK